MTVSWLVLWWTGFFHFGLSCHLFQRVVLGRLRQVTLHQGVNPGMPGAQHLECTQLATPFIPVETDRAKETQ